MATTTRRVQPVYFKFDAATVQALTELTAKLVDIRQRSMDSMLCTENIGPDIFGSLLRELRDSVTTEIKVRK